MRRLYLLIWAACLLIPALSFARTLEFDNFDPASVQEIQKEFPVVNKSNWTFADIDDVIQKLMQSQKYEELTLLQKDDQPDHFILHALPARFIDDVQVTGANKLNRREILEILSLTPKEKFDRKVLVNGAEKLKDRYGQMGYLNATIEISFEAPVPQKIIVKVEIQENDPCRMNEILIDTPNGKLKEALMRRVGRLQGQPLTEDRVNEIREKAQDYFKENRYLVAQISQPILEYNELKTQARVIFKIDQPYRYELIFEGNQKLTAPTLLRALDLGTYAPTTTNPAADLATRLTEIYKDRGYANATVDFKEKLFDVKFLKQIYFQIKEGYRIRIEDIKIGGTYARDPSYYSDFIRDHSTDLISNGFYNRQGVELGAKNLQVELQNQGYLRAKVLSVRSDFDKSKQSVTVLINLDEGPLTKISSIRFRGVEKISEAELIEELKLYQGSPLQLSELESGLERMKTHYKNLGYLEMSIANEKQDLVRYNDDHSEAELFFDVYEGPQVRVASIILEGNKFTKDYVILREISIHEGDILTPELISESTTRLLRLGIFSVATITTLETGTSIANRTVLVSVVEANPGIFSSGIGFTDEAQLTYRTYLGLSYNNINGTARAISGRADFSYSTDPRVEYLNNQFTIGYYEPFLFATRTRGRVSVTRLQKWYEYSQLSDGTQTLTIQQSTDGKIYLERDLTLHAKLTYLLYGYEVLRFYEVEDRLQLTDTDIASTGPIFDLDYRDNPFNPTKGSYTRWATEYARPEFGSSDTVKFLKTDAQYTYYMRVSGPRWVWANQVRGGFMQNLSDLKNSGIPSTRAFFLGGRTTVRGFEPSDERFPSAAQLGVSRIADWVVPNNATFYLLKTELRFPIYENFGGAIFYDGGEVRVSGYNFQDPYRDSVGFGFRYSTPVGPVNLELGYKIGRKYVEREKESPFRIHFSIGTF